MSKFFSSGKLGIVLGNSVSFLPFGSMEYVGTNFAQVCLGESQYRNRTHTRRSPLYCALRHIKHPRHFILVLPAEPDLVSLCGDSLQKPVVLSSSRYGQAEPLSSANKDAGSWTGALWLLLLPANAAANDKCEFSVKRLEGLTQLI